MINLYYDKLAEKDVPIPNGISEWKFTKDVHRIPIGTDSDPIVESYTYFFNCIKALGCNFQLFTGKDTAKNLFYPMEITNRAFAEINNIADFIPKKTFSRIAKGKMKLLLLMPSVSHDYRYVWKLRKKLDLLEGSGMPRDQVYIVLGDINRTYKTLLNTKHVYGIDWWQIYTQIALMSRYKMKDFRWVFNDKNSQPPGEEKLKKELYELENWNPKRLYSAFTGRAKLHNTCFITDLKYYNLDKDGKYSYNIEYADIKHNYKDFRITDKSKGEAFIEKKKELVKNVTSKNVIMDMTLEEIRRGNRLYVNKSFYEDSLVNIVSDSWMPLMDANYLEEIDVLAPGPMIWMQIAKGHPFMVLGCLNTIGYVTNQGYFSNNLLVNESYDRVSSITKTSEMICNNLKVLKEYTDEEIKNKVEEMKPFLKRNREKFFSRPNKRKFIVLFEEMQYER
jgi:hypothetical protein